MHAIQCTEIFYKPVAFSAPRDFWHPSSLFSLFFFLAFFFLSASRRSRRVLVSLCSDSPLTVRVCVYYVYRSVGRATRVRTKSAEESRGNKRGRSPAVPFYPKNPVDGGKKCEKGHWPRKARKGTKENDICEIANRIESTEFYRLNIESPSISIGFCLLVRKARITVKDRGRATGKAERMFRCRWRIYHKISLRSHLLDSRFLYFVIIFPAFFRAVISMR